MMRPTAEETDWSQILEWYDELVGLADNPIARLSRVVALAHVLGPDAALAELETLEPARRGAAPLLRRAWLPARAGR